MQIGQHIVSWLPSPDDPGDGSVTYKLYVGRASRVYTEPGSPFNAGPTTSYLYPITSPGTWFFAATAVGPGGENDPLTVPELVGNFDWPENPRQQHRGIVSMGGRRTSSGLIR
jgi:hypothetical protein